MAALNYPGPFCSQSGILTDALMSITTPLPVLSEDELSKGVVLELNDFRRRSSISWEQFHCWLRQLCPALVLPSLPAVKVRINRIETKLKELRRNKQHDKLHELSSESFFEKHQDVQHEQHVTESQTVEKGKAIACTSFDSEVLIAVNQELAAELPTVKDVLEVEEGKTDELSAKLSKLSIRNTNKKLRRRDDKIVHLKEEVMMKNKVGRLS